MIWNARSLQRVASELASGRASTVEDAFLFNGQGLAGTLLALATEIALKAWQCRERKGAPDNEHDLMRLFRGLSEDARDILQATCPEQPLPDGVQAYIPIHSSMRRILETHRNTFLRWRYVHETMNDYAYPPALNTALTAIIETYHQSPA